MKDYEIISWDWKEQIDLTELNTHLLKFEKPQVYAIDSGDDSCVAIITEAGATPEEINDMYNNFGEEIKNV